MKIGFKPIYILLLLLGGWAAAEQSATAFEYHLGGGLFDTFHVNRNFLDPDTLRFNRDESYMVTSGLADLSVSGNGRISGYLSGSADWIHDFEPDDSDDVDVRLVNAYLRYAGEKISADLGKERFVFGRGLILDDDKTGLSFAWSPLKSKYLELKAARADESSPLVSVTAGDRPGFLEKIELFGAYMHDGDNGFADLVNRRDPLNDPFSGDGDIGWAGVAADLFISSLYVSGIAMWETGRMTLDRGPLETSIDLSAWLFDAQASYNLSPALSSGIFLFAASGDSSAQNGKFRGFISPLPYNPRADIFFSGGLDGSDISEGFSLAGALPPGVIAPGVELTFQPNSNWMAKLSSAAFLPEAETARAGNWYGWETDLSVTRTWGETAEIFIILGAFEPGDLLESVDTIMSGRIGLSLFF